MSLLFYSKKSSGYCRVLLGITGIVLVGFFLMVVCPVLAVTPDVTSGVSVQPVKAGPVSGMVSLQ